MEREEGLGPASNPALPEPHTTPRLLRSPLLTAGGMVADFYPSVSYHFPLAVSFAGSTSLSLLCVFLLFMYSSFSEASLIPCPVLGGAGIPEMSRLSSFT